MGLSLKTLFADFCPKYAFSVLNSSIFNKNGIFPTVFDPGKDLYFEITPKFGVFVKVNFSKFRKRRFL